MNMNLGAFAAVRAFAALVPLALLGGCAPKAPSPPVALACEGGPAISIAFDGGAARLTAGEVKVRLAEQPAASGIHYAGGGHDLRGEGLDLTWTDPSGRVLQCREMPLIGTAWRLVHFQSSDDAIGIIVPPRLERYAMAFGSDGRVVLQLDCNRASAQWQGRATTRAGGSLTIQSGMMARAMCGPGAIDSRLARDLGYVRSYTLLPDGRLSLALQADAGIYLWAPAAPD
ncbi:META domain-containing protein [Ferrovibrio sp. MS7]|uniref:META domain-containing protein n=1 Tax=Ferrovibrio plantarum TaxID=3119164 RepID=UPI0031363B24